MWGGDHMRTPPPQLMLHQRSDHAAKRLTVTIAGCTLAAHSDVAKDPGK